MGQARDQAISAMTWCIQTKQGAISILDAHAREVIEAERAALIMDIKHFFAATDDPLYDDVQTLCGRIERGEYGTRPKVDHA